MPLRWRFRASSALAAACGPDAGSSGERGLGLRQSWRHRRLHPRSGRHSSVNTPPKPIPSRCLRKAGPSTSCSGRVGGMPSRQRPTAPSRWPATGRRSRSAARRMDRSGSWASEPWSYPKAGLGGEEGETFQITPLRPPSDLRDGGPGGRYPRQRKVTSCLRSWWSWWPGPHHPAGYPIRHHEQLHGGGLLLQPPGLPPKARGRGPGPGP